MLFLLFGSCLGLQAQDFTYQTFKDTRVINVHSVETLAKNRLDVRIAHRFGDFAGDNGGWATFYGLENASDVGIGAEYGISNRLTVGLHRTKGAGVSAEGFAGLQQLLNGVGKFRLARQTTDGHTPFSATLLGVVSMSTQKKLEGDGTDNLIASFPKFMHRFAFHASLVLGRKFSDKFSFQLLPAITHRNLVPFAGENNIFSLGAATRIQLSRTLGLVADATFPFIDTPEGAVNSYQPAIGVGLEIETGGHVFQVNFTNATGIMETDYIPYTTSDWTAGEFRLGFTISRWFNL
ncbi:MAG: hypothetical protein D6772_01705 [Bacteroidetes bacterium]|nr:MAG: hypothetical protein D6772_01705 [Bacteroidota bacterium]